MDYTDYIDYIKDYIEDYIEDYIDYIQTYYTYRPTTTVTGKAANMTKLRSTNHITHTKDSSNTRLHISHRSKILDQNTDHRKREKNLNGLACEPGSHSPE